MGVVSLQLNSISSVLRMKSAVCKQGNAPFELSYAVQMCLRKFGLSDVSKVASTTTK